MFHFDVGSMSPVNHFPTLIVTLIKRWPNYVLRDGSPPVRELGVWRSAVSSSSRVRGRAPAAKAILAYLEPRKDGGKDFLDLG